MLLSIIYLNMTVFHRKCGQNFQPYRNEQQTIANRFTENLIHDLILPIQILFY